MEIENHLEPFFPADEDRNLLVNAHRALFDKIVRTYPQLDPFVFIVLRKDDPRDPQKPAAWGTHSSRLSQDVMRKHGSTTRELLAPDFDVYRYFHKLASTASVKDPETSLQRWLGSSKAHFYLVPYIVRATSLKRIDGFHRNGAEIGDLGAWNDFLYTRPFSLDIQNSAPKQPSGAYFSAAMMFAVRDSGTNSEPPDLLAVLEAFFIQYQLSWSVPTLIKKKRDQMAKDLEQARLQHQLEERGQELQKRGQEQARAIALVNGIVDRLTDLSMETKSLQDELGRGEPPLFAAFQNASTFVPERSELTYYNWTFRHSWSPEFLRTYYEDFRQHLACLLLAFCDPKTLPSHVGQPWPAEHPFPSAHLLAVRERIPATFSTHFSSTVARILSVHDSDWTNDDVLAYEFLKGAFANPFKEDRKLTGPLTLLWADQWRHEVRDPTVRETFSNNSALNGLYWCSVDALPLLHDLIENHRTGDAGKHPPNTRLRAEITAIRYQQMTIGANVTLFECGERFVEKVSEIQERATAPASARRGSLTWTVDKLTKLIGRIEIVKPRSNEDSLQLVVRLADKDA